MKLARPTGSPRLDFAVMWALFLVAMVLCRTFSGLASKTRLRFKNPIDPAGGPIVGIFAAWVLATFTLATLHTSPMPKDAFSGKLVYDVNSASMFTQPDVAWLRFVETMSKEDMLGTNSTDRFTAKAFVHIYGLHREAFDKSQYFLPKRKGT